jgi:signal transduction histidine kinase
LAIEDITERKEIENGLEKAHEELQELAAELKRTTRAKSEFLANMSHELRTPLNSINGFSEILYDETFGVLNEKQKKYVDYVLTSGKHLLLLINQILDMAKVEAGKMKLALSSLPTKKILNEISLLIADMVSKKKIEMVLEIAEDLPDIEGDELKVKEILYNLFSNAVKFTPEGGKIGMRAKKADFEIEIVVWDTGVGIAAENMGKIFEGFFRVDTPYSRVTEGTGLGLPLSKKLVELHGGKFFVVSEGLLCRLYLERQCEMRKRALIVDDNENNLLLEKDLLEVAGFEVFVAQDASSGIAIARKEKPDIIIMDVRLPDMRGSEAAMILRQDKETSDIPIVFVTASVLAEGREEIKPITNSGFIGKPINTRTFVKEISAFIK